MERHTYSEHQLCVPSYVYERRYASLVTGRCWRLLARCHPGTKCLLATSKVTRVKVGLRFLSTVSNVKSCSYSSVLSHVLAVLWTLRPCHCYLWHLILPDKDRRGAYMEYPTLFSHHWSLLYLAKFRVHWGFLGLMFRIKGTLCDMYSYQCVNL